MRMPILIVISFLFLGLGAAYWYFSIQSNFSGIINDAERESITRDLVFTFDAWTKEEKPSQAGMMVQFPSGEVFVSSHGGLDVNAKRPVASLSKSITGLCIAGLVMDGKLRLDNNLETVLGSYFSKYGYRANEDIRKITIENLLTHRSGFFGNTNRKGSEFYNSLDRIIRTNGVNGTYFHDLVLSSLSQELVGVPGDKYIYSNTNYLVLGFIIEEISGETYEDYCTRRVLDKAGVNASLDPKGKILSSYAGWLLSPLEMLKVFSLFHPTNEFLSDELIEWHYSSVNKTISPGSRFHYGLGLIAIKRNVGDWNHHAGKWNGKTRYDRKHGSLSKSYATWAMQTDEGVGVFVVSEPWISKASSGKLRDWMIYSYTRGYEAAQ